MVKVGIRRIALGNCFVMMGEFFYVDSGDDCVNL